MALFFRNPKRKVQDSETLAARRTVRYAAAENVKQALLKQFPDLLAQVNAKDSGDAK